jgi:undecaprenyl-diphosphatase
MDAHPRLREQAGLALGAFVRARLSREGYLGLHLTLGVLVLAFAAWIFGDLAEDVVTADGLVVLDAEVADWLHAHATPLLTRVMLAVSTLHGVAAISAMSVALAAFFAWRRHRDWLLVLVLAVPGGMLLNTALKDVFERKRPHFDDPLVTLATYSFPSGHVAGSTLFYGILAAFLIWRIRSAAARVAIAIAAVLLVALVAASRMYLGAHWFSDVAAAFAESIAWLAVCLTGVNVYARRRDERGGRPG